MGGFRPVGGTIFIDHMNYAVTFIYKDRDSNSLNLITYKNAYPCGDDNVTEGYLFKTRALYTMLNLLGSQVRMALQTDVHLVL